MSAFTSNVIFALTVLDMKFLNISIAPGTDDRNLPCLGEDQLSCAYFGLDCPS